MNAEEIETALESEFGDVGIDIEGNLIILEKLRSICTAHELSAADLVAKWFTYSATKNDVDLTLDVVDDFNKSVAKNMSNARKGKKHSIQPAQPVIYDVNTLQSFMNEQEEDENMLQGYAKTPQSKGSGKRLHTTPDEVTNKRIANIARTPATKVFSPASYSPMAPVAPSPKYEARKNKGDVVASFPPSSGSNMTWQGTRNELKIRNFCEEATLKEPYKYMFEKTSDKAGVLDEVIDSVSYAMAETFKLETFERVTHASQEQITVAGRICCDAIGKLNSKSILLEGSTDVSNGERVKLDVNDLPGYSLFPGQVIAAKGIRSGHHFVAKDFLDGVRLPFNSTLRKDKQINESEFTVYITCGPYATTDTLSHAPLSDFLNIVESDRPDLVIMLGPFVDSKMPLIENAEVDFLYEDKFNEYRTMIMTTAISSGTRVIFVPSQRDVFHHFVYPQPPFERPKELKDVEKVTFASDPSTILVNDVVFGVTSTDILFHLGAEETSSFAPGSSDRLGRLAAHILKQRSYYPLQPPSEDINMDYLHFEQHCLMQTTPDILILPSDLRFFVKDVDGCLCINPGRLAKGQTGGTFAKLQVKPSRITNSDKSLALSKSIAHVVKL
eukprot:Seg2494.2 transcript_id=Seg2494.2/GoldUCD/mRNA.D3Y31 product="DNA polymerase alpha subunit B" protein_id=Seg2494.2/GoldUCD/D3Y31